MSRIHHPVLIASRETSFANWTRRYEWARIQSRLGAVAIGWSGGAVADVLMDDGSLGGVLAEGSLAAVNSAG
jgi:hypothetical protein